MSGYNQEKVDEAILALLYLNVFEDQYKTIRAWKSYDWDAMDRLYEKDPMICVHHQG